MAVKSIAGKVYVSPTEAGAGGTVISNVQDNLVTWDDGQLMKIVGGGLERDAWDVVRDGDSQPPQLRMSLRDVSAQTINLLFGMTTNGAGKLVSDINTTPNTFSLAVRPTSGDILYGPRWVLHPETAAMLRWSRDASYHDETEIVLMPLRSADGTKRSYMLDTASAINTYYGLPA